MVAGMTVRYEKITVSLPFRAAENVRQAVRRGEATSVSAYIAVAIEKASQEDSLAKFLDDMLEETGGPMTPAERRKVDAEFRKVGLLPRRRRTKAKKIHSVKPGSKAKRPTPRKRRAKR
jgi:Arc/MetJ-type ribon-helix-helix transcriptional regulator